MMKPIHKFNNGNGATLCHCCRKIINTGFTQALYCNEICDKKHTEQTRITIDNININKQTTKNNGKN